MLLTRAPLILRCVRLACVRPAASVRSEPGSNSQVLCDQPGISPTNLKDGYRTNNTLPKHSSGHPLSPVDSVQSMLACKMHIQRYPKNEPDFRSFPGHAACASLLSIDSLVQEPGQKPITLRPDLHQKTETGTHKSRRISPLQSQASA